MVTDRKTCFRIIAIFIIYFGFVGRCFPQKRTDDGGRIYISNFLKDPLEKRKGLPAIYNMTVHGMKKGGISLIGTTISTQKLANNNCKLLLNRYSLNKKTIFEMGKGKLGADSVVYFSLGGFSKYYILKYPSTLTLLGYFKTKSTINGVCIRLLTRYRDEALFTLSTDRTWGFNIMQYDYVAGYNYTE